MNTECCVQLNQSDNPDGSGPHWYCDAVVCDFRKPGIFLCEILYSAQLADLIKRLTAWHENWGSVCQALVRDNRLPKDWLVRPWLFVPEVRVPRLAKWWATISGNGQPPKFDPPRITTLESVQPWLYSSWNRIGEKEKPLVVPQEMRT